MEGDCEDLQSSNCYDFDDLCKALEDPHATDALAIAEELEGEDSYQCFYAGSVLEGEGRIGEAKEKYEMALEKEGSDVHKKLAKIHLERLDTPKDPLELSNRAFELEKKDMVDEAKKLYEDVVGLDEQYEDINKDALHFAESRLEELD